MTGKSWGEISRIGRDQRVSVIVDYSLGTGGEKTTAMRDLLARMTGALHRGAWPDEAVVAHLRDYDRHGNRYLPAPRAGTS